MRARDWMGGAALLLIGLLVGEAAVAETRRVEAVGIYGVRDSARSRVIPRDQAIGDSLREGVSRVALELIGDVGLDTGFVDDPNGADDASRIEGPLEREGARRGRPDPNDPRHSREGTTPGQAELLESALGTDMLPYTRSFRILKDHGERPVLFDDAPGIDTEYVVVVEVIVDVDRVTTALESAGLIASRARGGSGDALLVELVGLSRYQALDRVVDALTRRMGASRVRTLEFERERQLLSVNAPYGLKELARRLSAYEDPRLVLEPTGMDAGRGRIRVMAQWFQEPGEDIGGESAAMAR